MSSFEGRTAPRDVEELRQLHARGARLKYLLFWGHRPERDGSVGRGCLSQWWPAPFVVDSVRYATAEHWMMAGKARLFDDQAALEQVLAASHPRQAKDIGRRVSGFDEAVWREHRLALVTQGSVHKFSQHRELGDFLRGTGHRILVEASPLDPVWGIGLSAEDPAATDPARWRGLNLLGFALMQARQALTAQQPAPTTTPS